MAKFVVGIDEVGRGALAGPVVVVATLMPRNWYLVAGKPKGRLRDSKKLTPKQREAWFEYFKAHPKISYAIARVYPRQIEKRNIARAANLAAERAAKRLFENCKLKIENCRVFLDGGLYLGNRKNIRDNPRDNPRLSARMTVQTVIRGDEKIKAIAAASIVAKVHRDRLMVRLAKKYPQYEFEVHKGYGTRRHIRAIKLYGPSKVHRLTFLRIC